ncbi:MAG: flavodoxin [Bacteroidales bacterium]|nr:flavodoxin [Bacteroidales bacterium]MCB9013863.1 flavodoxin [Bacteroidales bacterium]
MKKTAILYGFNAIKTAKIAEKVKEAFGSDDVEMVNVETITTEQYSSFDNMVLGVPTWFDGELPNYWDEFIPDMEDIDMKGKKIAIFGLGDQKNYGENFVDGIGLMAEIVEECGATLVGFTSTEGYSFESSKAQRGNQFAGLAIDYENQGTKNKERVSAWVEQLKKEFD